MTNRFTGTVALVNAAAGAGIGAAVTRRLLAEDATVVITDVSERRLAKFQAELAQSGHGDRVLARVADAADEHAVDALLAEVADVHGRLDVLVNSVGLNLLAEFPGTGLDTWRRVLDTSLTSHFLHARAAWPLLRKSAAPAIVNISSLAAEAPVPFGEVAYAAAKAGVLGLTRALAVEGAQWGIRCNAVIPGLIWNERLTAGVAAEYVDAYRARRPLGRDGEPDEVADVILFLASGDSRHVTGQALRVAS
ncbi:oxidoreductase [Amycolatopsis deserti]|uniref:Oxidoreductase n=1 Tax=Amycolatopsis deserti TaxID=185696 RepID=A0ABQ3IYI9_9PSEU|nr:SDR family NAD(P)-dependent oxidoreductase [Amycolatopsis deserti]GHE93838.1 oxidoreductase [Amycolatopsis deserti]